MGASKKKEGEEDNEDEETLHVNLQWRYDEGDNTTKRKQLNHILLEVYTPGGIQEEEEDEGKKKCRKNKGKLQKQSQNFTFHASNNLMNHVRSTFHINITYDCRCIEVRVFFLPPLFVLRKEAKQLQPFRHEAYGTWRHQLSYSCFPTVCPCSKQCVYT